MSIFSVSTIFTLHSTCSISRGELRLVLFPLTLRDEVKRWANSLEHGKVKIWKDLIERFIKKFFPPYKNAKRRKDLMVFKLRDSENLHDA